MQQDASDQKSQEQMEMQTSELKSSLELTPTNEKRERKFFSKDIEWRRWRQHVAALIANLSVVATGVAMGWSAPALPVLRGDVEDPQPLRLSLEQSSWASALMPLGALLGALPAGVAAGHVGRRTALLALAPLFVAGWLLIAFSEDSVILVYIGRLVIGFAVGPCTVFVPMYCEEIAEESIRGALGSYLDMMMVLGNIVVYTLGALLPYFWFTLSSVSLPVVFAVAFWQMPETPRYLASKGKTEEARLALLWLRGPSYNIQPEFEALLTSLEKPKVEIQLKTSFTKILKSNPFKCVTVRAFLIVLGLMFFQQMSGINVFIFYAVQIFDDAGSNLSGHVCSIIIGFVHFIASLIAAMTVDRIGRRFLLTLSSGAATICLSTLAVYTYFYMLGANTDSWRWVPLTSLIIYLALYSVGFGTLPWFMMVELMPDGSKAWASAIAVCFNRILTLLLTKEFPILMETAGQDVVYGTFAAFCFAACLFVWRCVPETPRICR